ncbi:MAG: DNA-binding response regulator [Geminicoccaceae bacterium]|nr:MAG: DNA-binding response regulator [Geminicoccaceae bacterium]
MRALLVEDDPISAKLIASAIAAKNVFVETASSGEDGLELAKLYDFDIVLMDLRLPDLDGVDVIRRMRAMHMAVPVLVLSAVGNRDDKVRALIAGADDYLTKPFDPEELSARLQAIVRRSKGHPASVIRTGRLAVDLATRTVSIDDKPLHVTGKEYRILELLSLRKGMTLTKETFLDHLYGGMDEPEQKIIDVFICKLRKKIAAVADLDHGIETVWGQGYVLKDPPPAGAELAEDGDDYIGSEPVDAALELERLVLALLPAPLREQRAPLAPEPAP